MSELEELREKGKDRPFSLSKLEYAVMSAAQWMTSDMGEAAAAELARLEAIAQAAEPFAEINERTLKEFDDDMYKDEQILVGDIRKLAAAMEAYKKRRDE